MSLVDYLMRFGLPVAAKQAEYAIRIKTGERPSRKDDL